MSTFGGALKVFDRETGRMVKSYSHDPREPYSIIQSNMVTYITEDKEDPNILWLGTQQGSLDKFDKTARTITHYKFDPDDPDSLTNDSMWSLFDDGRGAPWIPTENGHNRLNKRTGLLSASSTILIIRRA